MVASDINDIYYKVLYDIKNKGQLKAKRRERYFLTFTLSDMDKNILFFPFAQRNWPWILREVSDRIFQKNNPGIAYNYSKNWENRIEDSGYFSYHYADRLNDQMNEVLSKRKQSRDKIVQVWKPGDYQLDGRQPCTITMQPFLEEDDKMSLIVYMRNNDMINIFPSDVFIHSTYFKYWAVENNIEYKNLYWVSAVAYYQKKRDKLSFVERLLNQWNTDYNSSGISSHIWTKETNSDLRLKEHYEAINIWNSKPSKVIESLSKFKTDYISDWMKIMILANYKKQGKKTEFDEIYNLDFNSEFSEIKNSIVMSK